MQDVGSFGGAARERESGEYAAGFGATLDRCETGPQAGSRHVWDGGRCFRCNAPAPELEGRAERASVARAAVAVASMPVAVPVPAWEAVVRAGETIGGWARAAGERLTPRRDAIAIVKTAAMYVRHVAVRARVYGLVQVAEDLAERDAFVLTAEVLREAADASAYLEHVEEHAESTVERLVAGAVRAAALDDWPTYAERLLALELLVGSEISDVAGWRAEQCEREAA